MGVLSWILLRVKEGGFILRFKVGDRGGEGLDMTHLLYANDTFVSYDTNWVIGIFELVIHVVRGNIEIGN